MNPTAKMIRARVLQNVNEAIDAYDQTLKYHPTQRLSFSRYIKDEISRSLKLYFQEVFVLQELKIATKSSTFQSSNRRQILGSVRKLVTRLLKLEKLYTSFEKKVSKTKDVRKLRTAYYKVLHKIAHEDAADHQFGIFAELFQRDNDDLPTQSDKKALIASLLRAYVDSI